MYPFILKSYQRFLHFLKKPDDRSFSRVNLRFKLKTLLSLLVLNVVLSSIWILGFYLVGAEGLENITSELFKLSFGTMVLLGVVVAPFIEEVIFRFPMKYSRNYLLQFLIALVALFAPAQSKDAINSNVRTFWKRHFWVFFYVLTSVFAFIHIYNYVDAKQLLLWSPLLTLAQFITGLIIGYIRVRFGFLWGWYYHGFYNLLLFSMAFASGELPTESSTVPSSKTETQVEAIYTKTLNVGFSNFKAYRVDVPEFSLYIAKKAAVKDGFAGYYGVTPTRIYFEQCSIQFMINTLSSEKIKIIAPNTATFDVEFKMKHDATDVMQTKTLMLREIIKAFSLK